MLVGLVVISSIFKGKIVSSKSQKNCNHDFKKKRSPISVPAEGARQGPPPTAQKSLWGWEATQSSEMGDLWRRPGVTCILMTVTVAKTPEDPPQARVIFKSKSCLLLS